MRGVRRLACVLIAAACLTTTPLSGQPRANPVVVFETASGNIEIEVDAAHAPVTAANFSKYVDGGFYDEGLSPSSAASSRAWLS
jgi:hypothetical protein